MRLLPRASPRVWTAALALASVIQLAWMAVLFRLSCGITSSGFTHAFGDATCSMPPVSDEARSFAWDLVGVLGSPGLLIVPPTWIGEGITRALGLPIWLIEWPWLCLSAALNVAWWSPVAVWAWQSIRVRRAGRARSVAPAV